MCESCYARLTFDALILMMINGLGLPKLLKIKIAGVELVKSITKQAQFYGNCDISKIR